MPRGQLSHVGDSKVNKNGYRYVKTESRGWVSAQQLLAEEVLGRELEPGDFVRIPDKSKRSNPTKDDIVINLRTDRRGNERSQIARLEAEITDTKDKLSFLEGELALLKKQQSD